MQQHTHHNVIYKYRKMESNLNAQLEGNGKLCCNIKWALMIIRQIEYTCIQTNFKNGGKNHKVCIYKMITIKHSKGSPYGLEE